MIVTAAEVFVAQERPSERVSQQFREAFYALADRTETAARAKAANLLARSAYCPRPVALFLAMDAPVVAMPMLRHSQALGPLDLAHVATKRGPVHQRLIAGRAGLPDSLAWSLAATNDHDVAMALLANRSITLPEELRAELEARTERKPAEAAKAAMPTPAREKLGQALAASRAPRRPAAPATPEKIDDATFATRIEKAAYLRDRKAMTAALQARWDLAPQTCHQVLSDHTGDALSVAMKAAGMEADQAHRVSLLAITSIGLSVAGAQRALDVYGRLSRESCLKAVSAWPKRETAADEPAKSAATRAPMAEEAEGVRRASPRKVVVRRDSTGMLRRVG